MCQNSSLRFFISAHTRSDWKSHGHGCRSACERQCPLNFGALSAGGNECEVLLDCICDGEPCAPGEPSGADPCRGERLQCGARHAARERLLLITWISLAGTSIFVLGLVVHAYRLTSPLGSPRSFAAAGYHGLATSWATPCAERHDREVHTCGELDSPKGVVHVARMQRDLNPSIDHAESADEPRRRERELAEAEHSVLFE